ncbi:IclR family transcriptional regulator [Aquibacillus salsiterrae]|uniref:Glycerol operon regulatory protein n=1 Tax=Aquibacillus salsiterrae TaxID=2950439 RepID=A0A9X3WB83_9BACI|nr:IclR family transcriptional regulator [Aquibacillus salsiterrae]MDC3415872.1 IclR family transcriptional regulator [Aquibacillus salsiterrae]
MGESVQSVNRALTILEILRKQPNGLGVTEISNQLGIAKSTSHRLLSSLMQHGFVQKDTSSGNYRLGLALLHLGSEVSKSFDVRRVALPFLNQLVTETGETAHLAIYDQGEIVYIDKLESPASLRMYSQIGGRAPAHCTGLGKAILSFQVEKEIDWLIENKGLKQFTPTTLTSKEALMKALTEVKRAGVAFDEEEHEKGIRCAAAPIFNHNNEVVAGISVAGPTTRISKAELTKLANQVKDVARQISRQMGR